MNAAIRVWNLMVLCCAAGVALAQPPQSPSAGESPAKATPQSEAGEPRANTSDTAPKGTAPTSTAVAAGSSAAAAPTARAPARPAPGAPAGQKSPGKSDRLELGTATVTGDREQPKVMYIVPWKRSDIGDLTGKPMNSLVDEILAPVDRDVFKREVVYYGAVQAEMSQNGASPKPPQQVEK
jgi:hypothetical protein